MEPKYIAAVELGSANIKGTVAAVDGAGGITVLAVEETPAADSVRYGRVQNAREASVRIDEILRRLENNPAVSPRHIHTIFVANGGRSLTSATSEATVNQAADAEVTQLTLERLHREASYNLGTDRDVLEIAPRRYFADNVEVKTILGSFGNSIRGEFTFLTCSPENLRNLKRVKATSHGQDVRTEIITRLLPQAELALTDGERQIGCLLLDFGAQTTTLAVYRDGALQMARTLPMGSQNITRDLATGLSLTDEAAENLKITKGQALNERANIDAPDTATREIINYTSARVGEIIANVVNTLTQAGFKPSDLPAGIVVCGRGARLNGFPETLEAQTKMKVRPATVSNAVRTASPAIHTDEIFDLVALAAYAAAHTDTTCLTAPVAADAPATGGAAGTGAVASRGQRPDTPAEDDPDLLKDDDLDQPENINDDSDDLPEPTGDPNTTRLNLLRRFKNWLKPEVDDGLDEEEEEE